MSKDERKNQVIKYVRLIAAGPVQVIEENDCLDPKENTILINQNIPSSSIISFLNNLGYDFDIELTRKSRLIATISQWDDFIITGLIFNKKRPKKVLMTWSSGNSYEFETQTSLFLNSLEKINLDCRKIVFTTEMSLNLRKKFKGFEIIDIDPFEVQDILRDRHRIYHNFIKANLHEEIVLICDSRDIVFQKDPFSWPLTENNKNLVFLFSEGWDHEKSSWNTQDQKNFSMNITDKINVKADVINGGILLGTASGIGSITQKVYNTTSHAHKRGQYCSDQAALNYLCHHSKEDTNNLRVVKPNQGFVAHGEAIKQKLFDTKHDFVDGKIINLETNDPFYLFHQWDRTEYAEAIIEQYQY